MIENDLEYLVRRQTHELGYGNIRGYRLHFFPLLVFLLAVFGFERVVGMLLNLLIDDLLPRLRQNKTWRCLRTCPHRCVHPRFLQSFNFL